MTGADVVFDHLHREVAWRCPVVTMYERRLHQPRLSAWYRLDGGVVVGAGADDAEDGGALGSLDPRPLLSAVPVLDEVRTALSRTYGVTFDSIGLNLYRDGEDSVAWHGDRHARTRTRADRRHREPRVVTSVPAASERGGPSTSFRLHAGDLLVMGGACQHDWEHGVPKVRGAGPRMSVTFRHSSPAPG
ncbi:MAG: alpha-ketoglutarate-dependent dioxygenase AlkB [Acidimicrobiia bacterium]|nr:alpha-ketoglutarate-dependent dioxygenase AlkB [Acidimicrobiia bacterium]